MCDGELIYRIFQGGTFFAGGLGGEGRGAEQPLPLPKKIPSKPFYRNKDQILFCQLVKGASQLVKQVSESFSSSKRKKNTSPHLLKNNMFCPSVGVNIKGNKFSCYRIVH